MLRDVEGGEPIGALVEYFEYSVASTRLSTSGMNVAKEIALPAFIGVSVYAGAGDFKQCLMDTTIRDRHSVYTKIAGVMQHFKVGRMLFYFGSRYNADSYQSFASVIINIAAFSNTLPIKNNK